MDPPYSTPGYPGAPKATPSSGYAARAALRAPIYNPYDKFTQPQFDAWIGDIIGALKHALGREDQPPVNTPARLLEDTSSADVSADVGVEDSFAEIKARRAAKGKERAREEDLSDDEEQEVVEDVLVSSDGEEFSDEEGGHASSEDAEEAAEARAKDAVNDERGLEDILEISDEDESSPSSPPVFDIDDVGDEHVEAGEGVVDEDERMKQIDDDDESYDSASSPRREGRDIYDAEDDYDDFPPEDTTGQRPVLLPDAWYGPRTYAEDYYSEGEIRRSATVRGSAHLLPPEMNLPEEAKLISDDEEDEDFPPQAKDGQPADIVDPWAAPQRYAEDLYTGGDNLRNTPLLSPSHLTPAIATPVEGGIADDTPTRHNIGDTEELLLSDDTPSDLGNEPTRRSDQREGPFHSFSASTQEQDFDASPLDELYAELEGELSPRPLQGAGDIAQAREPSTDKGSPSPKTSDNRPPVPFELHDGSKSPPRISSKGPIDWSWLPAPPGKSVDASQSESPDKLKRGVVAAFVPPSEKLEVSPPLGTSSSYPRDLATQAIQDDEDEDIEMIEPEAQEPLKSGKDGINLDTIGHDRSGAIYFSSVLPPVPGSPRSVKDHDQPPTTVPPEDIGFGDLPATPMDNEETSVSDTDMFDILSSLQDSAEATFPGPSIDAIFDGRLSQDNLMALLESGSEDHATFTMPSGSPPPSSQQIEREPLLHSGPSAVADDDDLASINFDYPITDAIRKEYVEEVEATSPDQQSGSTSGEIKSFGAKATQEISPTTPDAQVALRDITASDAGLSLIAADESDSEDEPSRRRRRLSRLRSAVIASTPTFTIQQTKGSSPVPTVLIQQNDLTALVARAEAQASPLGWHLDSGVPVPVSADPTVPDPTSVWGTPRAASPVSPSLSQNDDNPHRDDLDAPIQSGSLLTASFRHLHAHSISGLFTPATESESSPASPIVVSGTASPAEPVLQSGNPAPTSSNLREEITDRVVTDLDVVDGEIPAETLDDEVDAEGDPDPEYHGIEEPFSDGPPQSSLTPLIASEVDHIIPESEMDFLSPLDSPRELEPEPTPPSDRDVLEPTTVETAENDDNHSQATPDDIFETARLLKRKRMSPSAPSHLTRSISVTQKPHGTPSIEPVALSEGKGKAVDRGVEDDDKYDDNDDVDSIASSRNGEIVRRPSRGKAPTSTSRQTSRSSSIASSRSASVPREAATEPTKTESAPVVIPPPFVHAYGVLHHHHGKAPPQVTRPQPPPKNIDRSAHHTEPGSHAPAPILSMGPPTSSPVTRSNCRFHKISIPLDEDEPRVFFVVPGCSLSNTELMEEEEIEDHGDATLADNAKLVPNVEALNISSYLVGVLRQLVGVDILREQEIFYLPQEGDQIGLKPKVEPKSKGRRDSNSRGSMASASTGLISPKVFRNEASLRSPAKAAPPLARAASVSTVGSVARTSRSGTGSGSIAESVSGDNLSDEEVTPRYKRPKFAKGKAPELSQTHPPSSSQAAKNKRKKLGVDAAAYVPDGAGSEADTDDTQPKRNRAKTAQRGTKRSRKAETRQDDENPAKPKKRKVHTSVVSYSESER